MRKSVSRRDFLRIAGGTMAFAAGARLVPVFTGNMLQPAKTAIAQSGDPRQPDLYIAGTDGWIYLPPDPPIGFYHPDNYAPEGLTTYIFGFRNLTGLDPVMDAAKIANQKNRAQHNAPIFWLDQYDPSNPKDFLLRLTNLGLAQRPDLTDAHTLHWHGFRNVIPFFDGEPSSSVSVPIARDFTYVYRAREEGTYMYHCHVEDVEHVHMGMTGMVFVLPAQNYTGTGNPNFPIARLGGTPGSPVMGYAYNDGDGSTAYDREYAMFLSEVWAEAHWDDAHIQLPDWTDYAVDFALLNGRVYPDTLAPNASVDPFNPVRDPVTGDLIAPVDYPHLQYQPYSALVNCNAGDRVLLRFANLGFREAAMTLAGIGMRVVGRDATHLRGRDGTDVAYLTDTVSVSAGESFDVIFNAPAYRGPGPYDTYLLYNRALNRSANLSASGYGGQMTEVRVYPAGTLAPQQIPNT